MAEFLSPIARIACAGGPTNTILARATLGEVGVLGQKAVAWVQALGAHLLSQRHDRHAVEIAVGALADFVDLVGETGEQRTAVGGRMHGDRPDPHPARRFDDPAGDFAAVGDEDVCEHGRAPGRVSLTNGGADGEGLALARCGAPVNLAREPFRNWLSRAQLVEQRLRLFEVERVETLSEPAVDRGEKIAGLIPLALIAP